MSSELFGHGRRELQAWVRQHARSDFHTHGTRTARTLARSLIPGPKSQMLAIRPSRASAVFFARSETTVPLNPL